LLGSVFLAAEVKEACGLAAVSIPEKGKEFSKQDIVPLLRKMLLRQQHRGQLSAGITTFDEERPQIIETYKELGNVSMVFRSHHPGKSKAITEKYAGTKGIGHLRYATSGCNEKDDVQPFERHHGRRWKWFSFAFNGNIANFCGLKEKLKESSYHLVRNVDTEVIMHFISKQMVGEKKKGVDYIFRNVSRVFDGAYSLVFLNADGTLAMARDPIGFKPLCYAERDGLFAGASESCALDSLAENGIKDVRPGEIVIAENGGVEVKRFAKSGRTAHCMFEWVYFASPASVMEGRNVYDVRWNLGVQLAKQEKLETNRHEYVVVSVPDTSKPAADAYATELGLVSMEGLFRNRYVGRAFIEGGDRYDIAREKYSINKSVVRCKKIILVDDSVVRGTTSRALIDYIRRAGKPREIHLRVSCPPITCPCFYGIDMSTLGELIAPRFMEKSEIVNRDLHEISGKVVEKIRREIGVDSLQYQSLQGLVKAIGMEGGSRKLCMGCLTGCYPTPWGEKLLKKAILEKGKNPCKRSYE